MEPKIKAFIIATLRKASYRWIPRNKALQNAKIGRNQYKCAHCPEDKIYTRKEVQLDHINPVVPLEGFDSWDGFIDRLFCPESGFRVLCESCHKIVTDADREVRKVYRKLNKDKK